MTNPKSRRGGLFQIATERRKMPANGSDPVQIMKLIQPGLEEMQYRKTHTNGASVDSLSLLFRLGMPIYKRLSPGYHFEEGYLCLQHSFLLCSNLEPEARTIEWIFHICLND